MQLISIRWRLDQESRNGVQDYQRWNYRYAYFCCKILFLFSFFPEVANRTTFLIIASGFIYQSCPFSLLVLLLFLRKLELGPFVVQVIWRTLENQMEIFNRNKQGAQKWSINWTNRYFFLLFIFLWSVGTGLG